MPHGKSQCALTVMVGAKNFIIPPIDGNAPKCKNSKDFGLLPEFLTAVLRLAFC